DCSSASCTMVAPASVCVTFGSATGSPVAITQSSLDFQFRTDVKNAVSVADPLGNTWGIAATDTGKWTIGANIVAQQAPAEAHFATAYGQFQGYVAWGPTTTDRFWPTWPEFPTPVRLARLPYTQIAFTEGPTWLGL